MAFGTIAQIAAVRELAFGSIGASYTAIGTATTDHTRIICFTNSTNAEIYISLDGSTDQLRLAVNSFKLIDVSTNKIRDDGLFFPVGTIFYARRVSGAPTSGAVWVEVIHGAGGV